MKSKAKRIKDPETGKEIVIAKDGRRMNPNSLKNMTPGSDGNGFDKHPENINRNGANRNPITVVREKLTEVLNQEYWGVNENNEQTVMLIIKDAVNQYFNTDDERIKQEWFKILVGPIDAQKSNDQLNTNSIVAQNVIFLPQKNDLPQAVQPNLNPGEDDQE